jgi:Tetracyclin repressor-like, C-terminal domain
VLSHRQALLDPSFLCDADARFLRAGGAYVRFAIANPEYFRVLFGPYGAGTQGAARGRGTGSGGRSAYELLVEALTELAATGRITGPVAAAALTAWSAVHGLAALVVDQAIVMNRTRAERSDRAHQPGRCYTVLESPDDNEIPRRSANLRAQFVPASRVQLDWRLSQSCSVVLAVVITPRSRGWASGLQRHS